MVISISIHLPVKSFEHLPGLPVLDVPQLVSVEVPRNMKVAIFPPCVVTCKDKWFGLRGHSPPPLPSYPGFPTHHEQEIP